MQVDGFLFDSNRLEEGAAYLARLRDDRQLCTDMGERGRVKVTMYVLHVPLARLHCSRACRRSHPVSTITRPGPRWIALFLSGIVVARGIIRSPESKFVVCLCPRLGLEQLVTGSMRRAARWW